MKKLIKKVAEIKIFLSNGQGYFIDFRYPIMIAIGLRVYFPDASYIFLGGVALFLIVGLTILGWFDLRFIKLHQTLAEIQTEKYNPYFRKLKKRFK